MVITQLSTFLENKPGRLFAAIEVLANNGINISALSLADSEDYGILRLIVDNPDLAKEVLSEKGIIVKKNHVNAVAMDDVPGGAVRVLSVIKDAGLSIEYMYACVGKVSGKALMVVRTDDFERTEEALKEYGYGNVNPKDIYRI